MGLINAWWWQWNWTSACPTASGRSNSPAWLINEIGEEHHLPAQSLGVLIRREEAGELVLEGADAGRLEADDRGAGGDLVGQRLERLAP